MGRTCTYQYIGNKYNYLSVISKIDSRADLYRCICDCGKEVLAKGHALRKGFHKSCGCSNKLDLSGQKFNKLTVVSPAPKRSNRAEWICKCDCGNEVIAHTNNLKNGKTNRCIQCRKLESRGSLNHNWAGCGNLSGYHFSRIVTRARNADLIITVTIKDLWDLYTRQDGKCALTGTSIDFGDRYGKECTASLDRIDSGQGYILGNVQWLHKDVNIMKWDLSTNDFLDWTNKIVDNKRLNNETVKNGKWEWFNDDRV